MIGGARMKEKKDPAALEAFFSLSFFSFSSSVTRTFPSPIKQEVGRPLKGDRDLDTRLEHKSMTQAHG